MSACHWRYSWKATSSACSSAKRRVPSDAGSRWSSGHCGHLARWSSSSASWTACRRIAWPRVARNCANARAPRALRHVALREARVALAEHRALGRRHGRVIDQRRRAQPLLLVVPAANEGGVVLAQLAEILDGLDVDV